MTLPAELSLVLAVQATEVNVCQGGEMSVGSNTTMLHVCSEGHDWQAVQWAKTGWSVLVVCRRCIASQWVGGMEGTPGKPADARSEVCE